MKTGGQDPPKSKIPTNSPRLWFKNCVYNLGSKDDKIKALPLNT